MSSSRFSFKKGSNRITSWSVGLALLPLVWAVGVQVVHMGGQLVSEGLSSWWKYVAGALLYLLFEKILHKPMGLYVFGHELTHALSGLIFGAKVHSFKATPKGGEVKLSKSNAFIALSPYIFPFYAVLSVILFWAVQHKYDHPHVTSVFQFVFGAALAFHLSLTFHAFHGRQSDLKVAGFFLSAVIILLGNGLILGILGVSLFKKTPTLPQFTAGVAQETRSVWMRGYDTALEGFKSMRKSWTR